MMTRLLWMFGGSVAAGIADRALAGKELRLGPVTLAPGAIGAIGGAVAVMALGRKLPAHEIITDLVGGAAIFEGTKVAELEVIPALERMFPILAPPGASAAPPIAGQDFVGGFMTTGLPDPAEQTTDYGLVQAMQNLRAMAAA